MAALMRSGARKASEIVMLTFRTLQPSRFAMLSLDIDASFVSSSSHAYRVDGCLVHCLRAQFF
jgi:hypothetical protein